TLENVHITGTSSISSSSNYVGGLVGRANNLTINNSSSNAVVTGKDYIGGLVGYIYSTSSIKNSYASGDVSGTGYIGGLIGRHNSGTITITSSYATGNVTGTSYYVGGLAGRIYSSSISYAYASGAVEGLDSVGGLLGCTRGGSVSKSYASGNVKSKTTTSSTAHGTGGLIGYNRSTLYDTFSAGSVTRGGTSGYIGGLVGYNYTGSINRSYVLGKLTNARAFVGAVNSLTAINTYFIGETTGVVSGSYVTKIESKIEATYSSRYEGFNFDTIWGIEYGATTPYLRGLTIPEEVYIIE
ncbi:MAG: GLUG motif-containing protein, partial [Bacilli bacterium]|nr:GLUG motif-containing protein [Bacilli bacterium]